MDQSTLLKLADQFETSVKDVLDPSAIQDTRNLILAHDSSPNASQIALNWKGTATGFPLVVVIKLNLSAGEDRYHFSGRGSGLGSVGTLSINGTTTIKDQANLDKLINKTHSYQYNFIPEFSNINFFDIHSRPIFSFIGDATGLLFASGGGSGSWKK